METKTCKTCGVEKSLCFFYKSKTGKLGVSAHCIDCTKKLHKDYYMQNRDRLILKASEYKKTENGIKAQEKYLKTEKARNTYIEYLRKYRQKEEVKIRYIKNRDKRLQREYNTRERVSLGYAKQIIKTLSNGVLRHKDIPDSIAELKQHSLRLKRLLKQKKQKDEQHNTTDI